MCTLFLLLSQLSTVTTRIPCHKTFIAHYEHALADPQAYVEPLATFLELDAAAKMVSYCLLSCFGCSRLQCLHSLCYTSALFEQALKGRLSKSGKVPSRKSHKLTQYKECKALDLTEQQCYLKVTLIGG